MTTRRELLGAILGLGAPAAALAVMPKPERRGLSVSVDGRKIQYDRIDEATWSPAYDAKGNYTGSSYTFRLTTHSENPVRF